MVSFKEILITGFVAGVGSGIGNIIGQTIFTRVIGKKLDKIEELLKKLPLIKGKSEETT